MLFKRVLGILSGFVLGLSCLTVSAGSALTEMACDTLIEAEAGSVRNAVLRLQEPYASGGEYVASVTSDITDIAGIVSEDVFWTMDVPADGEYNVWLRVYFPTASKNAFYWRWDNDDWKTFTGKYSGDYEWINTGAVSLKQGSHRFKLSHKSANVHFDALYVTAKTDFVPEVPEGVLPMEHTEETFVQTQTKEYTVNSDGYVIADLNDASLLSGMTVVDDKNAMGKNAIKLDRENYDRIAPNPGESGTIELTVKVPEEMREKKYHVWLRYMAPTAANDSIFAAYNDEAYTSHIITKGDGYQWYRPFTKIKANENGEIIVRLYVRESGCTVDQLIITDNSGYMPLSGDAITTEVNADPEELVSPFNAPPYNPPEEHPRLIFRSSDIDRLKYNLENCHNEYMLSLYKEYTEGEADAGDKYSVYTLNKIQAKAYQYALYGDTECGRGAYEMMVQVRDRWDDLNVNASQGYRKLEKAVFTTSCVLDWCYDILTEDERRELINIAFSFAMQEEIGWPPKSQGAFVGHGAEDQFLRGMLAFAIASYNERPDVWNYIGAQFYEKYVPGRVWQTDAGIVWHQGSKYGIYRHVWTMWAYRLITGMGLPEPYDGIKNAEFAYGYEVYMTRPDGTTFLSGDDTGAATPMSVKSHGYSNLAFMGYTLTKDPYLKDLYIKLSTESTKSGITTAFGEASLEVDLVPYLIFDDPDLVRATAGENLPNSRYFASPAGMMIARTGWEDGVDSNVAMAQMLVSEYYAGNHQHRDAGSFQLYYKGPLAVDSGTYQNGEGYGSVNHKGYARQSIAHNTILVYDPNEEDHFNGAINDGGQIWQSEADYEEIVSDPKRKRAEVLAHEIDPKDEKHPEYTYLKGDIENAYSEKVSEFKRSFMFLDLDDEKYPAALIVFDKVTSSDASFKKTWLLHGETDPQISGIRSVWGSNEYTDDYGREYHGKMVCDSLLPGDNKQTITAVGGYEEGWGLVNGVDYTSSLRDADREENTYRIEVSPTTRQNTDYFLNCMQVTDDGTTEYLSTKLIDTDDFYGVEISDRVVLFSKSGDKLDKDNVSFAINKGATRKLTVCDIPEGIWTVSTDGTEYDVNVTKDGGVLAFESAGGDITLKKKSDKPQTVIKADAEDNKVDGRDIYVFIDSDLVRLPVKAEIVNDRLMVPISEVARQMKLTETDEFLKRIYFDEVQQIKLSLRQNDVIMDKSGNEVEMSVAPYYKDGELMVELRPFAEALNYHVFWDEHEEIVCLQSDNKVVFKQADGYAAIATITPDQPEGDDNVNPSRYINDGLLETLWAAKGAGRYIDIELAEETILDNIEIVFNPNNHRTPYFDVQISSDGVNYETIYTGVGDSEADGINWEVFTFDKDVEYKTKYIRYVANASDISQWNGVKEMRFKIGEKLVKWEPSENSAEIVAVIQDDGEVDANNVAANLTDNNARTIWAAKGKGRYVDFELAEKQEISGVEIVFNPNQKRTAEFEIQVSDDGKTFRKVYSGASNPEAEENTWESFKFSTAASAKYVRYVGNGSNISQWNGVKEIRFIKNK